jgi:eukaryotic-like serine/threonine-protein kinase
MTVPNEAKLYLGQTLSHYRVDDYLAPGHFGLVFEGTDVRTDDKVAIKILKQGGHTAAAMEFDTEDDLLGRLARASHVVDRIDSGNEPIVVNVPASGVDVPIQVRFLVLELADGCLEDLIVNPTALSWLERLRLFRGVAKGVHQMHLNDMAHRDIKSSNGLLFVSGQSTEANVSDLGRSRDLTAPARFAAHDYLFGRGDLRFAAPEMLWMQASDAPDVWRRADLYGLGSLLFEVATGQGITGVALGNGPDILRRAAALAPPDRLDDYRSRLASVRSRFNLAFDLFETSVPPPIRQQSGQLLRLLCDPDPLKRTPPIAPGRRRPASDGLNWLLIRVTILERTLRHAEAQSARLARRRSRAHASHS